MKKEFFKKNNFIIQQILFMFFASKYTFVHDIFKYNFIFYQIRNILLVFCRESMVFNLENLMFFISSDIHNLLLLYKYKINVFDNKSFEINFRKIFDTNGRNMVLDSYYFAFAFYFYQTHVLLLAKKQNKNDLIIHHFFTMLLLVLSYFTGYFLYGIVIMTLHDLSDPFLETARIFYKLHKTNKNIKKEETKEQATSKNNLNFFLCVIFKKLMDFKREYLVNIEFSITKFCFCLWLFIFGVTRLMYFPYLIHLILTRHSLLHSCKSMKSIILLLLCLLCMHIFWIIKALYVFIMKIE